MEKPGSFLGLEIAVERAAGRVCGLKSSFLQAKMGQAGKA
jgi:hypothetical protein